MIKLFSRIDNHPKYEAHIQLKQGTPVIGLNHLYNERAKFMGLSEEHLQSLKDISPFLFEAIDEGIDMVLNHIFEFPYLKEIATNKTSRERLVKVFTSYISSILEGSFDETFHTMRNRMGSIHLKAGLPIGWFLATFSSFQSFIIPKVVEHLQDQPKQLATTLLAINHVFNLDGQMVVEDYMNSKIAQIEESHNKNLILSKELITISHDLAASMEQSEAAVLETTNKTQIIKENNLQTSKSSTNLVNLTLQYEKKIEEMTKSFDELVEKMNDSIMRTEALKDISGKITNMTQEIQKVADQTNLLALNAAIEAARAGHEGKGFSVVANEVRKLAENSKTMSNHIVELISQSTANIDSLARIMSEMNTFSISSQTNMTQVKSGLTTVKSEMSNFIDMFNHNSKGLDFIAHSIQEISQTTQNLSQLSLNLIDKAESLQK